MLYLNNNFFSTTRLVTSGSLGATVTSSAITAAPIRKPSIGWQIILFRFISFFFSDLLTGFLGNLAFPIQTHLT